MIIDTSFLVDFLRNSKDSVAKMRSLINSTETLGVTSPTIFEIWTGLFAIDKYENERRRIDYVIDNFLLYPLDAESAKISGKINGELIKKGTKIDPEDCMIAGIAIAHNKKILTRDEHFKRIEGLKVEGY